MSQNFSRRRSANIAHIQRLAAVLLLMTGWFSLSSQVKAQPGNYPPCQPPQPGESLLLVVTNTDENQQQVLGILPPQVFATACNYLDDIVLRVEGFPSINAASNWAEYINGNLGLSAFVALPQDESAVTRSPATVIPDPYNPQPLGQGYAVLVDYFNNPQVATELQQVLRQNVGLVSYQQRPYLLAEFTSNQNAAKKVLQTLSDRGFWVFMVDAPRVILLRSEVTIAQ